MSDVTASYGLSKPKISLNLNYFITIGINKLIYPYAVTTDSFIFFLTRAYKWSIYRVLSEIMEFPHQTFRLKLNNFGS